MHTPKYPPETVVPLETGNELRCPAYPKACTYVRIVDPVVGEVAYWDAGEWHADPEGVMGAIIGAMKSTNEDAEGVGDLQEMEDKTLEREASTEDHDPLFGKTLT